jgi:hypothetical protein
MLAYVRVGVAIAAVFVTACTVESFTVEEWATGRVREFENATANPARLDSAGGAP